MLNISDENAPIDRQALAQEVIVSAGNVLRAAGFGREEIGFFFRQAADMLGGASIAARPDRPTGTLARVVTQFAASTSVQELQCLGAEGQGLLPFGRESPQLKQGFDMAMQIVPLLAEAQAALRQLAEEAGLPLFATRGDAAAAEGEAVCLEAFELAYADAQAVLVAVIEALLECQDGEAFAFLLGHLAENGVVVGGDLQAAIAKGAAPGGG